MRLLPATLLLLPLSALAQTQVPNVFEDGTPATAAEVNENFQYVMENASGGCSATQQDNSVLIECADGTSGVIAGAGTVVVVPEGTVGEAPDISVIPIGDFYWEDGNSVLLSKYYEGLTDYPVGVATTLGDSSATDISLRIHQVDDTQALYLADCCAITTLYYADVDCQGMPWAGVSGGAYRFDGQWWVFRETDASGQQTLLRSTKYADKYFGWDGTPGNWAIGVCSNIAEPAPATIGNFPVSYEPPAEWLNAAYPLTLVQKP